MCVVVDVITEICVLIDTYTDSYDIPYLHTLVLILANYLQS